MGGGLLWKIKFLVTRGDPGVTKESRTRQTSRGGGPFWKIKFLLTRPDPGMTKESRTKADLAWGGALLENNISFDQG